MSGPVTLPFHCVDCCGAVLLQLTDWNPRRETPLGPQAWICPYCLKKNDAEVPGKVAWATKRYAHVPRVR